MIKFPSYIKNFTHLVEMYPLYRPDGKFGFLKMRLSWSKLDSSLREYTRVTIDNLMFEFLVQTTYFQLCFDICQQESLAIGSLLLWITTNIHGILSENYYKISPLKSSTTGLCELNKIYTVNNGRSSELPRFPVNNRRWSGLVRSTNFWNRVWVQDIFIS